MAYKKVLKTENGLVESNKKFFLSLKNIVTIPFTTTTRNGVTFTNNGDGSVTVNGTATADAYQSFTVAGIDTVPQPYKVAIRGCPSGGSSSTFFIGSNKGGDTIDYGNGTISDLSTKTASGLTAYIMIKKGYIANNLVFRPQYYILPNSYKKSTKTLLRTHNGWAKAPITESDTPDTIELQGVWVLNDTLTQLYDGETDNYNVNFTIATVIPALGDGVEYTFNCYNIGSSTEPNELDRAIQFSYNNITPPLDLGVPASYLYAYGEGWKTVIYGEGIKTLHISSKLNEVENGDKLLAWLNINGKKTSNTPSIPDQPTTPDGIVNLINTTWEFNSTISLLTQDYNYCNGAVSFTMLNGDIHTYNFTNLYKGEGVKAISFDETGNYSEDYIKTNLEIYKTDGRLGIAKTIAFTGGVGCESADLISYMKENARLISISKGE